jgi:hypothetical protein
MKLPSCFKRQVPDKKNMTMVPCPPGQLFGTLLRVKNASEGEAGTRMQLYYLLQPDL